MKMTEFMEFWCSDHCQSHLSDEHMIAAIDPRKDSDFMDIRNMSGVLSGKRQRNAVPAEAVISLLRHYKELSFAGGKPWCSAATSS